MLFDAADAPGLRRKVAELEAAVTSLTAQVARLERKNKWLQSSYDFYYAAFTERQIAIAEEARKGE